MAQSKRVLASALAAGFAATTVGFLGVAPASADGPDTDPEVVAELQAQDWPEYSEGHESIDVFAAKHQLHYLDYEPENLNSVFENSDVEVVEEFQDDHGITEDDSGTLGQETWEVLTEEGFDGGDHSYGPGDRGHMVMMIQRLLNAKYQMHIGVDGEYGSETEEAVEWVQGEHDIDVDGRFGEYTFTAVVKDQDYDT